MDIFGIGSAVKAAAEIYFNCARRTGRTTALIKTLKPGDRVYFASHDMSQWFKRRLREHGVEGVECEVWNMHRIEQNDKHQRCNGRAILDHTLIEALYLQAIDDKSKFIKQIEDAFSKHQSVDFPPPKFADIGDRRIFFRERMSVVKHVAD